MVQAAVIEIDRSTGRHFIICHTHLRMTESRCPLIDTDSMLNQIMIEGTGHTVDHLLVWDTRCYDTYINTTLCCQCERMRHLVCNDQIWSDKPAVSLRFVRHTDIYFLAYLLTIERTVCIWLDITTLLCLVCIVDHIFLRYKFF